MFGKFGQVRSSDIALDFIGPETLNGVIKLCNSSHGQLPCAWIYIAWVAGNSYVSSPLFNLYNRPPSISFLPSFLSSRRSEFFRKKTMIDRRCLLLLILFETRKILRLSVSGNIISFLKLIISTGCAILTR